MRRLLSALVLVLALAVPASGQGHIPPATGGSAEIVQQPLGPFLVPAIPSAATGQSGLTFSASGHKICYVFRAPKTGAVNNIGVRIHSVTNNPDNGIRFSFQAIDPATGNCDGTPTHFRDYTTALSAATYITTGLVTDDGTDTGAKRTLTVGELVGIQIEFISFVAGDAFVINATTAVATSQSPVAGTFYTSFFNGSAWAKHVHFPTLSLHYADGSIPPLVPNWVPWQSSLTRLFQVNTVTLDEYGLRFTVPGPVTLGGAWLRLDLDGDAEVLLYDEEDNLVVAAVSLDKDIRGTTNAEHFVIRWEGVELTPGSVYRLTVRPTTTTSITAYYYLLPSVNYQHAIEGSNSSWYATHRVDAGEWTDVTDERPLMGLIITEIGAVN